MQTSTQVFNARFAIGAQNALTTLLEAIVALCLQSKTIDVLQTWIMNLDSSQWSLMQSQMIQKEIHTAMEDIVESTCNLAMRYVHA